MEPRALSLLTLAFLTACASDTVPLASQGGADGQGDGSPALDAGLSDEDGEDVGQDDEDDGERDGDGVDPVADSDAGGGDCDPGLQVIVRDFTEEHPDFEHNFTSLDGIVKEDLGADKKPVYAASGATVATSGPDAFDQWYRDVDGVNMRVPVTIEFTEESPGVFVYDNSAFFPIDGQGFGNGPGGGSILGIPIGNGGDHNFLFTTEAHTLFTYHGGEEFTFRGDDDLWVFINDKLAVDLGGLHSALSETIDLDARADYLGIEVGKTYPMDIFHAERHTDESNYRIETTIDLSCIQNVPVF